jgi:hypothetical protein
MRKHSLGGTTLTTVLLILVVLNCASQNLLSQGAINENNYQQIAALTMAVSRLPEEAALAGYFTAHEDPTVDCVTGLKVIKKTKSKRVNISYNDCDYENITWTGTIQQPADQEKFPYAIIFGQNGSDFGFFQRDATFFAPFAEQIGFAFKGDFSVENTEDVNVLSGSNLDVHIQNSTFDNLYTFRNMNVNRSYDSSQAHYGFAIITEISSDLLPTIDCEVTSRFQRYEDQYPYQGAMSIVAIDDNSQIDLQVIPETDQVLLRLDSDNDTIYEQEQTLSWEEIKQFLPAAYQSLFSYYWHS